ncbi:MAG: hypothetical protein PUB20_08745 [Clostridia bacterium]|nr:hypothetical protein [Clostridia bacterium]
MDLGSILESIDIQAILTAVTDFLAQINLQQIINDILAFLTGFIGQ